MSTPQFVQAQQLHKGQYLAGRDASISLRIKEVQTCFDVSIRVITNRDEQRMSPAFMVRVLMH